MVLAVNLGGALIPLALSVYLLLRHEIYAEAGIGIAIVAFFSYLLARPLPGVGIAISPIWRRSWLPRSLY